MRHTPPRNASYLARALLNTEVTWPFDDPNDVNKIPMEQTVRLDRILFSELPETLFDTPERDAKRYGRTGLDREFDRLGKELRRLRTTSVVDISVLQKGWTLYMH